MGYLRVRLDLVPGGAIGPGKIELLERIGELGSISAAGRSMGMSYRKAWLLVDGLNQLFRQPVLATRPGGSGGGGAEVTEFGRTLIARYRAIEREAEDAVRDRIEELRAELAAPGS